MQPLITPNWHIAFVHFPIGLILIGTLVELFSFLGWRGSGFRRAGRWMLLIGAVWAVPATFSGLYAWQEVLPKGGFAELQKTKPALAKAMSLHIWTNAIATAAAMGVVVLWLSLTAFWRDRLNLVFKILLIGISGLIIFGSHMGGESVYNHGLAVDTSRTPTTLPTLEQAKDIKTWEQLFPPVQTHVVLAGLASAAACITLGLAIHTASNDEDLLPGGHAERIAAAFAPGNEQTLANTPVIVSRNATPPFPVARFWLLSAFLLIVTALVGDWIIAQDNGWTIQGIWDAIRMPVEENGPAVTRRLAHLIAGGVIIVDTIILALLARFAPRQSILLLAFALPLVLALAAQIWLGVLLLFDGPAGMVTRFNG